MCSKKRAFLELNQIMLIKELSFRVFSKEIIRKSKGSWLISSHLYSILPEEQQAKREKEI